VAVVRERLTLGLAFFLGVISSSVTALKPLTWSLPASL